MPRVCRIGRLDRKRIAEGTEQAQLRHRYVADADVEARIHLRPLDAWRMRTGEPSANVATIIARNDCTSVRASAARPTSANAAA